jgi:hypothetical protein
MNDRHRREKFRDHPRMSDNARRRSAARQAIRAHRRGDMPKTPDEIREAIIDVITDLKHLAAAYVLDWDNITRLADMHHHDEQAEEARETIPAH